MSPQNYRDSLLKTLSHINEINTRLVALAGPHSTLKSPDYHKLSEGLLLSAWTHWEQYVRDLFIEDLAANKQGLLGKEVKKFRTKRAGIRLATALMEHPDNDKNVDWGDFGSVVKRSKKFLGERNRFVNPGGRSLLNVDDIRKVKTMRNAVAHKGDNAGATFKDMAKKAPFSLKTNQMKGITVGRFLVAHEWGDVSVIEAVVEKLATSAKLLVP